MMEKNIIFEERIQELKSRAKRCVCKYCGGPLKIKLLDFGQIETANLEVFCDHCNLIEYGVEPEIYHSAVYLVDVLGFNAYPDRTDNAATRKLNIAKICELISWHDMQIGVLDQDGYTVPIKENSQNLDYEDGSLIVQGEELYPEQ